MGEALIIRRDSGFSGGTISGYELVTRVIDYNTNFIVPNALNQSFSVRIFGGGGGASGKTTNGTSAIRPQVLAAGGGGGYMNFSELVLKEGDTVPIIIGSGGACDYDSSIDNQNFNGSAGGITSFGTYLSANGGSAAYQNNWGNYSGGSGGSGGGAGGRGSCNGGTGYQFGGGGGISYGGNGGTWGGGGGGRTRCGVGGTYGGNGGEYASATAENGTNTIGYSNIEFVGKGLGGHGWCGGGGGYGGNGGDGYTNVGGGGGGFGSNGGTGARCDNAVYYSEYGGAGGGGGYGDDGVSGRGMYFIVSSTFTDYLIGGGGGGYGKGGYGRGGTLGPGKSGVCVIQYQAPIYKK